MILAWASPFKCGGRLETLKYDIYRRQILTSRVHPRAEGEPELVWLGVLNLHVR